MNEDYISLTEATRYCDYSQEYLSLRARQGKLKSVKFGKKWVTKKEWLEEYLKSNSKKCKEIKKPVISFSNSFKQPKFRYAFRYALAGILVFSLLFTGIVFSKDAIWSVISLDKLTTIIGGSIVNSKTFLAEVVGETDDDFKYSLNIFQKFIRWYGEQALVVSKIIKEAPSNIGQKIMNTSIAFKQEYQNANDFVEEKLSQAYRSLWGEEPEWPEEKEEIVVEKEKIDKELEQALVELQAKIEKMEREGLPQKEIIKEVQKITQIEPLKEITKEIKILDSASLTEIKSQLAQAENNIKNLQSNIASFPSSYIGSGTVSVGGTGTVTSLGVSAGGFQYLDVADNTVLGTNKTDTLTVNATSNFGAPVTINNTLTIGETGSDASFTVDTSGNVNTDGNIVVGGDFTVTGAQTYSGAAVFTVTSSADGLLVNQQGAGNVVRFQTDGADNFIIANGGQTTITSTSTPQLTVGYDASNYLTVACGSSGNITFTSLASLYNVFAATGVYQLKRGTEAILAVDANGAIDLTARGTNQDITITPSGAGVIFAGANLDMNQHQIIEPVIHSGTYANLPSSPAPVEGQIYFATDKNQLYVYDAGDSRWHTDRTTATKIVAASDSQNKEKADYVCDGTADDVQINAAITALPSAGGLVYLLEGTYNLKQPVVVNKNNVVITGAAKGATILNAAVYKSGIAASASSGQPDIEVLDASQYYVGEKVYIYSMEEGETSEINTIASISNDILTMVDNLQNNYSAGDPPYPDDNYVKQLYDGIINVENRSMVSVEKIKFTSPNYLDSLQDFGVLLKSSSQSNISSCSFNRGATLGLDSSSNCLVENNELNALMRILSSSNNSIINNYFGNLGYMILTSSNSNIIRGNKYIYYLKVTSCSKNIISGNTIIGRTPSANGVELNSSDNNVFSNNVITGSPTNIALSSSNYNKIENNYCDSGAGNGIEIGGNYNIVIKNRITTGVYGVYVSSGFNTISYNEIDSCSSRGIFIDGADNNKIIGNTCNNNGTDGITLYSSANYNIVEGNVCYNNADAGILLEKSIGSDGAHYNTITGNSCYENQKAGIALEYSDGNVVNNNNCYKNNFEGIWLTHSSDNNTVSGNVCINNGQDPTGIYLNDDDGIKIHDSTYNIISDNRCTDTQGTKTQEYGIEETGSSNYNTISDNDLRGNKTTDGLSVVGAATSIAGNRTGAAGEGLFVIETDSDATLTALTVTQAGTGDIVNLTGDSITSGTGMALSVNGLITGTGLDITSTSTAGGASGTSKLLNLSRSGTNANASHTAYGIYSSVANTGTTSINIAGYFTASGADTIYGLYSTITAASGTTGYGLYVDAGTGAGAEYAAAFVNGNVGIGTATPGTKLDVVGNIQNIANADASPTRVGAVTLAAGENTGYSIAVSGRYAYVSTYTSPARVVVVDISNPVSPTRIGAVTLAAGENTGYSIAVSGRYAYVSIFTNPARVVVVDISNPVSPTRVGAVTLAAGENYGYSIAVSGRYAYVSTGTSPARVVVVDISNPVSPTRVGAVTLAAGEDEGLSIAVSRRYAYVSTETSPARVVVVDISNPASPTRVGAVTLAAGEDWGYSIAVSGRYAYVSTYTSPAMVVVVDISNPASPTRIGAVTLAAGENISYSIAVSGRYAYVLTWTSPARVVVVDISNPVSPIRIGAVILDTGENYGYSIAVSGRYAYILTCTSPARVVVVDIKGIEATSIMAHSLEAGSLQVRNDIIAQGQLQISGGVNIGSGGLFSAGNISGKGDAYFGGNLGIGTTVPLAMLSVAGNAAFGSSYMTTTSPTDGVIIEGSVGIGDTTPTAKLKVVGALCVRADGNDCAGNIAGDIYYGTAHSGESDVAELFFSNKELEPGDVVRIKESNLVEKTVSSYEQTIIGVISTKPGLILGSGCNTEDYPFQVPVALVGRVPVKVNLENGPIKIGDFLTSSSEPGVAMKATGPGRIIGQAFEPFDGTVTNCEISFIKNEEGEDIEPESCEVVQSEIGKVMTLVNVGWQGQDLAVITDENDNILNDDQLSIINNLSNLGLIVSEYGTLEVQKLKTKTMAAEQMEMRDKATGHVWCTWIENGEWQKQLGECVEVEGSEPDVPDVPDIPPVDTTTPSEDGV
ncbi:right-handed parallel beta-helix repeat-containing protein [Candidatus Parcubacteria bacterium]|nr:right-handed parallel beta-helix repeat-containing protein [Candidatus Parcubacteria bacterium]